MKKLLLVTTLVVAMLFAIVAVSMAQNQINGCYNKVSGVLRIVTGSKPACTNGETPISWNKVGPKGDKGDTGATGATGPTGPAGVANGITRAVHGAISGDGQIIQGSGFHFGTNPLDRACSLDIFCWVTIYFDTPFSTTPTCTVSDLYGGGDEIHLGIGNVTETTFTVDTRHGEYDVIIVPPPVYAQHLPFTFICVE